MVLGLPINKKKKKKNKWQESTLYSEMFDVRGADKRSVDRLKYINVTLK